MSNLQTNDDYYINKNNKQALASKKPIFITSLREPGPYDTQTSFISNSLAVDNAITNRTQQVARASRKFKNEVRKPFTKIEQGMFEEYTKDKFTRDFAKPNNSLVEPEFMPTLYEVMEIKPVDTRIYEEAKLQTLEALRQDEETLIRIAEERKRLKQDINNGVYNRREREKIYILKDLDTAELEIKRNIQNVQNHLQSIEAERINAIKENDELQVENNLIKKNNKEKLEVYRKELEFLNGSMFSSQQLPGESEEDYYYRLQQNIEVETPTAILEDAKVLSVRTFREKMKELILDPVKIENVANSLDEFEEADNKAELLSKWEFVKSKFLSTYGFNNKRISASDIVLFFKRFLEKGESGLLKVEEEFISTEGNAVVDNISIDPFPSQNTLRLTNNITKQQLFLKSIKDESDKLFLLYSFTGEKGTYKEYFTKSKLPLERRQFGENSAEEIQTRSSISTEQLNKIFNNKGVELNTSKICKDLLKIYKIQPLDSNDPNVLRNNYRVGTYGKKNNVELGYGLHNEDIPQYAKFGNVIILLRRLYYDNVLSVVNNQKKAIGGLPISKVTEQFVKIIMNMTKDIMPTHTDISTLPANERHLYDRLIIKAKLNKKAPHQKDKSVQELKKRLKLLEAEIEIGNNSPLIKKEITQILYTLKDFKTINDKQIKEYLAQI